MIAANLGVVALFDLLANKISSQSQCKNIPELVSDSGLGMYFGVPNLLLRSRREVTIKLSRKGAFLNSKEYDLCPSHQI